MRRSSYFFSQNLKLFSIAVLVLICTLTAVAQTTTTTTPLTPAQQRAQARAAQQAAAKQAAEARQAAAKEAAENKAAARTGAASNAANTTAKPLAAATNATSAAASTTPAAGTTARSAYAPATAATPTSSTSKTGAAGTVGSGTLAFGQRVYSSSGCVHNGNSADCTFTFVNQGNEATLAAGGAGELSGIQLVDDAHVPHKWTAAHFLDKYGTQQPRLIVQPGDTGTYVVTFENVNPQVTSAEFHLRNQIVGGITFSGAQSATASNPASTANPATASPRQPQPK